MDITPTPDTPAPQYPKKKRTSPPIIDIQVLDGIVMENPAPIIPHFTKTDLRLLREMVLEFMSTKCMQILGGEPYMIGSEEDKKRTRQWRRYERLEKKLMQLLEYLEHT